MVIFVHRTAPVTAGLRVGARLPHGLCSPARGRSSGNMIRTAVPTDGPVAGNPAADQVPTRPLLPMINTALGTTPVQKREVSAMLERRTWSMPMLRYA
jgi:hypothetical protein